MRMWRVLLAAAVALVCCAGSLSATTYYVAASGSSDSYPGTLAQPWATLQHAVDTIAAGDTIQVRAGTYVGCLITSSGQAGAVKTLMTYPGETAVVNTPGPSTGNNNIIAIRGDSGTVRYWTVSGLEVCNSSDRNGISLADTEYITVQNCYAHDNGWFGIFTSHSYHVTIQNNESASNDSHGIYHSNSGDYAVIRGNTIHNNSMQGVHMNGDASMSPPGDGIIQYATVEKNVLYENGAGYYSGTINGDGVCDSIIRNNLVYANHNAGICLYGSDAAAGSSRDHIYNNTIVMASDGWWGITIPEGGMDSQYDLIYNNIVYSPNSSAGCIKVAAACLTGFMSDYNAVGLERFSVNGGDTILTLSQWQSYGYDTHSFVSTPAALFVNPTGNDYHLKAGSPAVNAGTTLTEVTEDMEGVSRPQGGAYDIGAYERASAPVPPVASFTGNPTSGSAPLTVAFTDTSTNTPTSWSWNFGDSSTSASQSPGHSYAAGTFTVSLRATNAGGYDDEVKTNYITATVAPPVAAFSGTPTSGTAPLAMTFTDASTNTPTSWSWNFGDSSTSTVKNPSHTYNSAASYTVSLRATNAGGYDDEVKTNYITVTGGGGGSIPTFVAAGAVASGTGTITPALPAGIASNDILLLFLETANQAVTISNQNGGTWTAVTNSPQGTGTAAGSAATQLTAFWSRYNGTQGAPTASDSGNHQLGRIVAIRGCATSGNPWDVTAGGVESTVDTSGSIPGATTTVANTLVVAGIATALPDASGTANFSAWTSANLTSLTEQTDNTVTAGNGGGLGVVTGGKATAGAYGNTAVTCATAAAKGMLSIALKPAGGGSAPVAAFSGTPTSGTAPLSVTFTDSSTNTPTSWSWNFGDSSTSTSQNPSHSYAAGTYTVSLRATNAGGYDDEVKTSYITATSGGSEVYVYPVTAQSCCGGGATLVSGTLTDLQTDNNVYMVYSANTSSQKCQVRHDWDTTYVPADVSKIRLELQFKCSRSDTPTYALWIEDYTAGALVEMRAAGLWYTTDTDFVWETTDVSRYMNSSGQMYIFWCTCPQNSENYTTSIDVTRIKLTLN